MNKQKCLKALQDKIEEAIRQKDIVATLPIGWKIPIEFNYWGSDTSNGWKKREVKIAGIIDHFNLTSATLQVIAVQYKSIYPFNRNNIETFNLKYVFLKEGRVIPKEDLPFLLGWEYTTPLLSKLIKEI